MWNAGRVFGAVTVLPSLLAAAWLVPGLPLLLAGKFYAWSMVLIAVPLAVVLCYLALRRVPQREMPWWPVAATVAIAVVFAGWQVWMRTQQIIFLRDPATYLQVGYWIAHHGALPIPQSAESFGPIHSGLSFASVNYYPRGTGLVPQFMTGFPVVIAGAIWLGGIPAALVLTPLAGGCAVLAFGGLAGRLAGARWAPVAAGVLALTLPQQYTSRSTFSEPLAQVLLLGGLSLLADSLAGRRGARVLAGLAGLVLGLTIFVRLDGLSDILPAVPFAGLMLAARRRQGVPFGAGLVVGVGYGIVDGYVLSRPYLDLEAPSLRPLGLIVVVVVLGTVAGVLVAPRAGRFRPGLIRRRGPDAVAAIIVLVFIALAVRPLVQTVAGETDPTSIAYVAELQKLAHLPADGRQQYYQDSLYWVIWYLGVPGVLLGVFGLAEVARNCTRALVTWRDPEGTARIWALPVMIALWVIVTVLWRPAISPDQPWASRRLVPFVLPGLILGGIWAISWLKARLDARLAGRGGRTGLAGAAAACCCVAALVIPVAWATFGISLSPRPTARGMAFKRIGAGELTAVSRLCAQIPAHASVVFLDQLTADRFAQVVRGECATPAAVLPGPEPSSVAAVVAGIERAGRQPVLMAQSQAALAPYGSTPREVLNLLTTQEAHELTSAPTRTWLIHYTVWLSEPPPPRG